MRLILHADDFGSSSRSVAETIACFEQGVLTSASIMPAMPATDEAVAFALAHPELDFGVHLTFVGDNAERPLLPPDQIPALATADGRFRGTRDLRMKALVRTLPVSQIERELARQLESILEQGVRVTHVDSHRHMHKLPSFAEALRRILPRFGIRCVRSVQDVYLGLALGRPTHWLGWAWQKRLARSFATTDHFYMPSSTSDTGWGEALLARVRRLDGSTLEVGIHPSNTDERASLVRFVSLAREEGHPFIAWKDIS